MNTAGSMDSSKNQVLASSLKTRLGSEIPREYIGPVEQQRSYVESGVYWYPYG